MPAIRMLRTRDGLIRGRTYHVSFERGLTFVQEGDAVFEGKVPDAAKKREFKDRMVRRAVTKGAG